MNQEDLTKAARKVSEAKKHESTLVYLLHLITALRVFLSQVGVRCTIDTHVILVESHCFCFLIFSEP
jgi:hypothetical protein